MPKLRLAQTAFSLGEFSPQLAARSDLSQYRNGAERLFNRRLLAQGGTDTRPGTRHVGQVPEGHGRLLAYVFGYDQRYLLRLFQGGMQPYLPDGTPVTGFLGAPWSREQIPDIKVIQSGDTMLLFHPAWPVKRIRRVSATAFVLDDMPIEYAAYYRFSDPGITLSPSALTGSVTVTSSANVFVGGMVGSSIRYRGQRLRVDSVNSATSINATWVDPTDGLQADFDKNPASIEWDEIAWSDLRGWPRSGAFFGGRLAIGGSRDLPNVVWLSKSGAYFNFQTGPNDGDGLAEIAAGNQSGAIVHLVSASRLLIMTDTAAWALVGGTGNGPITPGNVALRPAAQVGAGRLTPAEVDGATLFLDRTGEVMREILIDEYLTGFSANPVSLLAEHLIRQPVAMTVLRGNPDRPEVYAVLVNADGELAVFHSLRQEKIAAFVPWGTAGQFRDVCAVGPDLFALVERTTGWNLERFDDGAEPVDNSRRVTLPQPGRVFPGFGQLAGQTVAVVSRGHDLGDVTVASNGTITLPERTLAVDSLDAGLRYRQIIRPMPADVDLTDGPGRGLKKRLLEILVTVNRAGQFRMDGRTILLQFVGDDVGTPAPTFTGTLRKKMFGISTDAQFDLEVEGAQKITVLGLTRRISVNG